MSGVQAGQAACPTRRQRRSRHLLAHSGVRLPHATAGRASNPIKDDDHG